MRRDEMLARLNACTSVRYGTEISKDVLYDFLESKIVITPEKHGRVRNWTHSEYRQLLEIARLKSLGLSDHSEIRWMMWLKRRDVQMGLDRKDREFLAELFDREIARLFRGINSTYPQVKNRDPTGYSARTVLSKIGSLDESLNRVVKYRDRELLGFYELLKCGNPITPDIVLPPVKRIGHWLAASLKFPIRVPVGLVVRFLAPHIVPFITGIAKDPDRGISSVANSVRRATPEQFEHARKLLELSVRLFRLIGLRKVAVSLLHPTWRLPMLALTIHCTYLSSRGRFKWLPTVTEIDLAEKIFS